MNIYWLIAAPAWVIVFMTALARLADHDRSEWAFIDHVRRMGMIGAATAAAVMFVSPFMADRWEYAHATWRGTLIAVSWACICVATRNMPPWWDWIIGVHRQTEQWKGLGFRGRLVMELRALAASFRPRRYRRPMAGPVGPLP